MTKIKTSKHTKEFVKVHVEVGMNHVSEAANAGGCQDPSRCMEKVAIFGELEKLFGVGNVERVRIDGQLVKTIIKTDDGKHRWFGLTPKSAKNNLIKFDAWTTKLKRSPDTACPIQPHAYTIMLEKGTKVLPHSPDRKKKINKARAARVAAGIPDKKYARLTTHDRVIGMASI